MSIKNFTTEDADRLLQIGDGFLDEWAVIRPLFVIAPDLLAALQDTTEALANVLLHHGARMSEHDRRGRAETIREARALIAKLAGEQEGDRA
ncbi:MAG: hypothetical protein M3O61_13305 [Gemmatimonadota bacterium]|nr:hypothetical protein [Gemmatimonadota bacterium]